MDTLFKLSNSWEKIKDNGELIPFGAGRIGHRVISTLMKEFDIPFVIDNSHRIDEIYGIKVVDLQEALNYIRAHKSKIVVTTVNHSYQSISEQLRNVGLEEFVDFCIFERFVEEWNIRWKNKCVLSKIDTVLTSKCTLRCKNCNMFICHTRSNEDIEFDVLKQNFDIFFDSIDFVYEYTLLGGEPFVHSRLIDIIQYLGDKYGDKIGQINIISNGTVIPNNNVIAIMKKYNVMVNISDYTKAIPYEKKLKELEILLKNNKIEYYVIPNNTWKDVLYPTTKFYVDDPKKHMFLCGHGTHSVNEGRLYWCDPAYAAEKFVGFKSKEDDYLDLKKNKENNSKYQATLNIMNYLIGNVNEDGYMSICKLCAGVGTDNENIVIAGEQLKNSKEII